MAVIWILTLPCFAFWIKAPFSSQSCAMIPRSGRSNGLNRGGHYGCSFEAGTSSSHNRLFSENQTSSIGLQRRTFVSLLVLSRAQPARAAATTTASPGDPRRPYAAETEALVPATQVRALLRQAIALTEQWRRRCQTSDIGCEEETIQPQLQALFEKPSPASSSFLSRKTGKALRRQYEQEKIVLVEDVKRGKVLQQLSGGAVRSALNAYTDNLMFGESYVLTASPALKKALIRSDQLPDIKTVITADLDLRDLYRNQVQTALEDIQAELALNLPDPDEVQRLLQTAESALDQWFGLIGDYDVASAQQKLDEIPLRRS